MARLPYLIPYDPDFLGDGFRVDLLRPSCRGRLLEAGRVFDYIHFSLVMHQDRKMALYTAHNIDVSQRQSVRRTGWNLDPRIDRASQTGPEVYANNPWDRGHRGGSISFPRKSKQHEGGRCYAVIIRPEHQIHPPSCLAC